MRKPSEIVRSAISAASETLRSLADLELQIAKAADLVTDCLTSGHKILGCGNGGSAADAADFCAEFACRFAEDRRPYPALNLAVGGSLLTAVGNDYGFEEVFARQVAAYGSEGDVLVCLTTSGKSKNIVRALEQAKRTNLKTIHCWAATGDRLLTLPISIFWSKAIRPPAFRKRINSFCTWFAKFAKSDCRAPNEL